MILDKIRNTDDGFLFGNGYDGLKIKYHKNNNKSLFVTRFNKNLSYNISITMIKNKITSVERWINTTTYVGRNNQYQPFGLFHSKYRKTIFWVAGNRNIPTGSAL